MRNVKCERMIIWRDNATKEEECNAIVFYDDAGKNRSKLMHSYPIRKNEWSFINVRDLGMNGKQGFEYRAIHSKPKTK